MNLKVKEVKSKKGLEELINAMELYLPISVTVYNMLLMMKDHKLISPTVYAVEDDGPTSICIITQKMGERKSGIAVFSSPEERGQLETALRNISVIETSARLYFSYIPWYIAETVNSVCLQMGFQLSTDQRLTMRSSVFICSSDTSALSLRVPSDYTLDVLRIDHADIVYKNWSYRESMDWKTFNNAFRLLDNSSVYKEGVEQPVAWVMEDNFGQTGRLYTDPEHRRKGLGSIILLSMLEKQQKQGLYPYTVTCNTNLATRKLFHTLQLQRCLDIDFLFFYKNGSC